VQVEQPTSSTSPSARARAVADGHAAVAARVRAGANPLSRARSPKEVKLPSKSKEGVWVGIRGKGPDDPRLPAKLLYVSPLKSRFLFADKRGKTVLECTRVELAKRFKMRDLILLAENPDASLFERIINGVLGKLGTRRREPGPPPALGRRLSSSFRLYVGFLGDLLPALDVALHDGGELRGRLRPRLRAFLGEGRGELGARERAIHLRIQPGSRSRPAARAGPVMPHQSSTSYPSRRFATGSSPGTSERASRS
jgi:hypothetical protein